MPIVCGPSLYKWEISDEKVTIWTPLVSPVDLKKCTHLHIMIHFYYLFAQQPIVQVKQKLQMSIVLHCSITVINKGISQRVGVGANPLTALLIRCTFWINIAFCTACGYRSMSLPEISVFRLVSAYLLLKCTGWWHLSLLWIRRWDLLDWSAI